MFVYGKVHWHRRVRFQTTRHPEPFSKTARGRQRRAERRFKSAQKGVQHYDKESTGFYSLADYYLDGWRN